MKFKDLSKTLVVGFSKTTVKSTWCQGRGERLEDSIVRVEGAWVADNQHAPSVLLYSMRCLSIIVSTIESIYLN